MRLPVNAIFARVTNGLHAGHSIDLVTRDGLVFAPEDAQLVRIREAHGCGYGAQLTGARATIVLCHFLAPALVSGRVSEGQLIAVQGYSGHVIPPGKRGTHVHFQINRGDWVRIWTELGLGRYLPGAPARARPSVVRPGFSPGATDRPSERATGPVWIR